MPGANAGFAAGGEALRFEEIVFAVAQSGFGGRDALDSGVKNGGRAVVDDGAAGEAAVGVGAAGGGRERDGEMRPVKHVGADGVGPVHVSPDGGVGVVLEKHVIAALEVERPVWDRSSSCGRGGDGIEGGGGRRRVGIGRRVRGRGDFWGERRRRRWRLGILGRCGGWACWPIWRLALPVGRCGDGAWGEDSTEKMISTRGQHSHNSLRAG